MRKFRSEAGLLLLLACFIALKIPDLPTPYFWDEVGVYGPGVLRMADGPGPSLMPAALDPEYSRGHPLMCYALYAAWMRLVGEGVSAAHVLSLILACAALMLLFGLVAEVANRRAALLAATLLAAQPPFFSQSALLLPEMLLTVCTIAALWASLCRRWGWYFLAASAALLTKESALAILPATCGFWLVAGIRERAAASLWQRWKPLIYSAAPLAVFVAFLLVQKAQHGWYFFPLHVGFIDISLQTLGDAALRVLGDLGMRQGRWFIAAAALAGLAAVCVGKGSPSTRRYARMVGFFVVAAVVFAATNYYLMRYALYILPFLAGGAAIAADAFAARFTKPRVRIAAVALFTTVGIALGVARMDRHYFRDVADMSYLHVVRSSAAAIRWAEGQPWAYTRVGANFPIFQSLQDPRHGYVQRAWPYSENCEQPTRYAILWHSVTDEPPVPAGRTFRVVRRFTDVFSCVSVVEFE